MAIIAPSVKWYDGTNIHQYNGLVDDSNNTHPTFSSVNQARAWYYSYYFFGTYQSDGSDFVRPLLFRHNGSKSIFTPLAKATPANESTPGKLWLRANNNTYRGIAYFQDRVASDTYNAIPSRVWDYNFRIVVSDWVWVAARCNYSVQMHIPDHIISFLNTAKFYGVYNKIRLTMGVRLDKSGDGDYINGDTYFEIWSGSSHNYLYNSTFNTTMEYDGSGGWQQVLWLVNGGINTTQYWGRPRIDLYSKLDGSGSNSGWTHRGYMNDYSSKNYSSGNIGSGGTYYFSGMQYTPDLKRVLA